MDELSDRLKKMTPLQRAVFALRETQARLDVLEGQRREPVAIVGMACRFPGGASDPESYWRLLCDGVDAVREVPPDRWDADAFYDPDPAAPGKMATRCGGFLEDIDLFDPHFFGISERAARRIDPQQRLLLELTWEALEDAGLPPAALRGSKTGVFIGIANSEYSSLQAFSPAQTDADAVTGTALCLAANRLSYHFGLNGPSLALDTACSSALVAVHLACLALRSGECSAALAGAVNLLLSPIASINLTKAGFCSTDGRVRAFDRAATGYVRSEGAGLFVLKPLSAASRNKDRIYAVIRGSAVNQNGISNGMTAPSRSGQEAVLREAYARAHVSPGDIQYVETQGSGTPIGDTIEALALGTVLREGRPDGAVCLIGSVKTNLGHLEAASGAASLMKAALALGQGQVPANLHFHTPNPDVPFDALQLRVPQQLETWPSSAGPRLAGVSAFGFGGSNAHVVLAEAPPAVSGEAVPETRGAHLLPISARTDRALQALTLRYADLLQDEACSWPDVCYSAAVGREHHDCRLTVLADSRIRAADLLRGFLVGDMKPGVWSGRRPHGRDLKVALVYGGRLDGWLSRLPDLAANAPGFSSLLETVDAALRRVAGWSLATALKEPSRGEDPARARTALLGLQWALTAWWRSMGVTPQVVVGEGTGELAAACAAGILEFDDALRVAAGGVGRNRSAAADSVRSKPATLPFLSSVDRQVHLGPDLGAGHWQRCLDDGGEWTTSGAALQQRQVDVCLEVGPASLAEPASGAPAGSLPPLLVLPTLASASGGGQTPWAALGALSAAGAALNWDRLAPADGRLVRLPAYPWQRQRLWMPLQTVSPLDGSDQPDRPAADAGGTPTGPDASGRTAEAVRRRPDLTTPYVAPRTQLEDQIGTSWAALLRLDRVGVLDNFFELGGDSLQATILLNHLKDALDAEVPGHVLFQAQTIAQLAEYLQQYVPAAVQRLSAAGRPRGLDDAVPAPSISSRPGEGPERPAESDESPRTSIPRLARDGEAERLLARLDELTDDEVQALLSQSTSDGEVPTG
jgi:acyl transferase domain-containing protein